MKKLFCLISIAIFLPVVSWAACTGESPTWTTDGNELADLQECLNEATLKDGDTINVIAGDGAATWATSADISATDLNIIGPGETLLDITCTAATCISIGVNSGVSSNSRVSGFTFINGNIQLTGLNTSNAFRIDNCTFESSSDRELVISGSNSAIPPVGLIDNCTFQSTRVVVYGTYYGLNENDTQHSIWARDPDFGGPEAVYIEDCVFTANHPGTIDCNYGGRYVYRYNNVTLNATYANEFHGVQGLNRAGQRWEIYGNTINVNAETWTPSYLRGASGFYFDNTIDADYNYGPILKVERSCESKSPFDYCDGSWPIDGNTGGKSGWPCRDQIGRVQDTSLSSGTSGDDWQSQNSYPAYAWNNTNDFTSNAACPNEANLHNVENQDFYNKNVSFNGTTGVGVGTASEFSAFSASCTAGVGYWVTDEGSWNLSGSGEQGRLYKCTGNDWSLLYTPYEYPHPLRDEAVAVPANAIQGVTIN